MKIDFLSANVRIQNRSYAIELYMSLLAGDINNSMLLHFVLWHVDTGIIVSYTAPKIDIIR